MELTGVFIGFDGLKICTVEGRVVPGTKLIDVTGRRGCISPGPGCALLIRCARCKCHPPDPMYPTSMVVFCPRLFSNDVLHCWIYWGAGWKLMPVKLTTVLPSTG